MTNKKEQAKEINKSFDFMLFITVLLLLSLGITMVLSASSPSSLATTGSSYTYVLKQLFSAAIGIVLMLILSKIDYKIYSKFYKIAYILAFVVLLLVLVPSLRKNCKWRKKMDKSSTCIIISTIRAYKNRSNSILCNLSYKT